MVSVKMKGKWRDRQGWMVHRDAGEKKLGSGEVRSPVSRVRRSPLTEK